MFGYSRCCVLARAILTPRGVPAGSPVGKPSVMTLSKLPVTAWRAKTAAKREK